MLPEFYTHPERFSWYFVQTNEGRKRTIGKTVSDVRKKIKNHGLKIISIKKYKRVGT